MSTTYCITTYENRLCGCLLKDSRMFQLQIFSENKSLLGNIYVGKVQNILKNIDAAFVEIAGGQTCFLPFSEAQNPILTNRAYDGRIICGDELLVQVKKDAVKTKDPVLTAQLSFPGRYCAAIADGKKKIQYSHKLPKEQVKRLACALKTVVLPEQISLVIRTESQELEECAPLLEEAEKLLDQAQRILRIGASRTVFSRISQEEAAYCASLRNLSQMPDKVITDQPAVHAQLYTFLKQTYPEMLEKLVLYKDSSLTLFQLYGLTSKIQDALSRQVWLKSGGYLVIEPTEALVVIDVNTGKFTGKKEAQDTFFKINLEAAEEIARQLQVRNLSGIIVVDFINMNDAEHKKQLIEYFSGLLKEDPVTARLIDMTPLGLVEITRKKVHMSLAEQLHETKS